MGNGENNWGRVFGFKVMGYIIHTRMYWVIYCKHNWGWNVWFGLAGLGNYVNSYIVQVM